MAHVLDSELATNPFSVKSPENLSTNELVEIFVPYPEYENLQVSGHQFLHGHRGSGKSMMLRMMTPEAQCLSKSLTYSSLLYYGVYLSIKTTEINNPEYIRLENEAAGTILSEHVLTTKLLSALFVSIRDNRKINVVPEGAFVRLPEYLTEVFYYRLKNAGWEKPEPGREDANRDSRSALDRIIDVIDELQAKTTSYVRARAFSRDPLPYNGALVGFQDTLIPIIDGLFEYGIFPKRPVFFLLDDADNLSLQQTKTLNSWVSYRSTAIISLKISTQLKYKTFKTNTGIRIESPHDYSEIDFTSVQTGSHREKYKDLVKEIIQKRLAKVGIIDADPYVFFPSDKAQDEKIKAIADEIKSRGDATEPRGYRSEDDAYRYARPEYIRRLAGPSKQGSQYLYAGFEQLVHISSGIIRYFIEPAAKMYSHQLRENRSARIAFISPAIQDAEIRQQADELLIKQLDSLISDEDGDGQGVGDQYNRLRNLINAVGAIFQTHLMDETASQRRVFSFSLSGQTNSELDRLLELGIEHGYFYQSAKGTKDGKGRMKLYVLTRRLAPAFKLDPMGFSGYCTIPCNILTDASINPKKLMYNLKKHKVNAISDHAQLSLLEEV